MTALIHLGYLGYDADRKKAFIPNYEVASAFESALQIGEWSEIARAISKCDEFLDETIDGNAERVAELIENAYDTYTSILKYNDENSLSCVLTMAYFTAPAYYNIIRDLQDSIAELNIISEQMQIAIAENSRVALDQDEYEKRYAELTARYEKSKAKYDDIAEQIESKKAKRELFKGFIRTLEKQDGITYEFDAGIWSSLVQEVIVKAKDDIVFKFKNGFEVRV